MPYLLITLLFILAVTISYAEESTENSEQEEIGHWQKLTEEDKGHKLKIKNSGLSSAKKNRSIIKDKNQKMIENKKNFHSERKIKINRSQNNKNTFSNKQKGTSLFQP